MHAVKCARVNMHALKCMLNAFNACVHLHPACVSMHACSPVYFTLRACICLSYEVGIYRQQHLNVAATPSPCIFPCHVPPFFLSTITNEYTTARFIECHPPGWERQYLDAIKTALLGSAQHDRLQHFSEALQGVCGVWQILNIAHVLPEGRLGVEGVVL